MSDRLSPLECCAAARKIWLSARSESELKESERLYRLALSSTTKRTKTRTTKRRRSRSGNIEKKRKHDGFDLESEDCGKAQEEDVASNYAGGNKEKSLISVVHVLKRSDYKKAGEKLALLMCQSGRSRKATSGLSSLGYVCRLSDSVLDYTPPRNEKDVPTQSNYPDRASPAAAGSKGVSDTVATTGSSPPCLILDDYLDDDEIGHLRSVFSCPSATYWTDHDYSIEPPSPYFSYVLPLLGDAVSSKYGFVGRLARRIQRDEYLVAKFPRLAEAKFAEMWAHNRPHASGHQLHFDSDDEGRGGVRNPVVSIILYVTAGSGGPSLVTNQRLGDKRLASRGWLSHPKERRLVAFDGRYLHGVVPGKGARGGRRVTLMFAFWGDIRIRLGGDDGVGPGSARPFPLAVDGEIGEWAKMLVEEPKRRSDRDKNSNKKVLRRGREVSPIEIETVYETLEGKPWSEKMGLPEYDEVFQGF